MAAILNIPHEMNKQQARALALLCGVLADSVNLPNSLYDFGELVELAGRVDAVCAAVRRREALEAHLLADFTDGILEFDEQAARIAWNTAQGQWFLPKLLGSGKVCGLFKPLCKRPEAILSETIPALLDSLTEYKVNARVVRENDELFGHVFELVWNNGRPDCGRLKGVYDKAVQLRQTLNILCPDPDARKQADAIISRQYITEAAVFEQTHAALLASLPSLQEELGGLETRLVVAMNTDFDRYSAKSDWCAVMQEQVDIWLAAGDRLRDWCAYAAQAQRAQTLVLDSVVDALESGAVQPGDVLPAYQRELGLGLARLVIGEDAVLSRFSGSMLEADITAYREQCDLFEALTRQELAARLSAGIPSATDTVAASSEIGILKRAIKSGGRMMSIRKLFDSIPGLLPKL